MLTPFALGFIIGFAGTTAALYGLYRIWVSSASRGWESV